MEEKMADVDFWGDIHQLIRPDRIFDMQTGYELVRTALIDRLQNR